MAIENLQELYVNELKDMHYAESELTDTLAEMAEKTASVPLRAAFLNHLEETKIHLVRLEEVLGAMGEQVGGVTCEAIKGLIKEAKKIVKETRDSDARDAALIAAAQKVEHYEIASYGTIVSFAKQLGYADHAEVLVQTLNEEKRADEGLTELAESGINSTANFAR